MDYDGRDFAPENFSSIRVRTKLKIRLYRLSQAWSGVNRKRLSLQNVIEILATLAPGKLTDEEIASVKLSTKPPGRPRRDPDAERKILCFLCKKEISFEEAIYREAEGAKTRLTAHCSECVKDS